MKRSLKLFGIFLSLIICFSITNIYAACSASISASSKSITVGSSVTITAKATAGAWNLELSGEGQSKGLVGQTTTTGSESASTSLTFKPSKAGTYTFYLKGDITDYDTDATENVSKSVTVTVKEKEAPKQESQTQKPTTDTKKPTTTQTTKPNNTTTTTKKPTTTTTKKPATTTKKSKNADIIGLTVNVEGLSPKFDKDKTSYKLKVGSDIEKLRLGISLDDSRATYRVTGNKNFKTGENTVKIIVTAEDAKTTKTYKIVVDKEPDLTLESLVVENGELTKEFDAGVLEYTLKDIDENVKSLKINAVAKSEESLVVIEGNENLVAGENTVKITVSTEDNKYSKTYTLKVNKKEAVPTISENVEEEIVEENSLIGGIFGEDEEKIKQNITIIALYLLAIVEFVQVVYLYKKLREANPDYERITLKKDKEKDEYKRRKVDIEIDDSKNEDNE